MFQTRGRTSPVHSVNTNAKETTKKATALVVVAAYSKAEKGLYDFYEHLLENKTADAMAAKNFAKEQKK